MGKSNKKILITGGAGYIGHNLISFFLSKKYRIYVIDNLSTSTSVNKNIKKNISFFKIDLTEDNKVKSFAFSPKLQMGVSIAIFYIISVKI